MIFFQLRFESVRYFVGLYREGKLVESHAEWMYTGALAGKNKIPAVRV